MRKFRIFLSAVMLTASLCWLLIGTGAFGFTEFSERTQIIPSAIQSCLGTTVAWIIFTLLFGRIYCSTVCPVGTMQDIVIWAKRKSTPGHYFRFKNGQNYRYIILVAYLLSLVAGVVAVGYVLEPWNMMRNAASAVRPEDTLPTWGSMGISLSVGITSGGLALLLILLWAWKSGRAFCTEVCPIGTMLGCLHSQTLLHIAIDPDKCIGCMKCEVVCPSKCIKVEQRYVDNSRCVRCFDCIDVCPNAAIRYQVNKGRQRQNPLLNPS